MSVLAAVIPADQVPDGATVHAAPGVQVDLASRTVLVSGRALRLTRLEFDLLALLAGTPRRVFTRAQLHTRRGVSLRDGTPARP